MTEIQKRFDINRNGDLTVGTFQDVQVNADWAQHCRDTQTAGRDMRHKWHLPNNIVNQFYMDYAGDGAPPPMNQEFWTYVDKRMNDPQYSKFRTDNSSNPFFAGYKSR